MAWSLRGWGIGMESWIQARSHGHVRTVTPEAANGTLQPIMARHGYHQAIRQTACPRGYTRTNQTQQRSRPMWGVQEGVLTATSGASTQITTTPQRRSLETQYSQIPLTMGKWQGWSPQLRTAASATAMQWAAQGGVTPHRSHTETQQTAQTPRTAATSATRPITRFQRTSMQTTCCPAREDLIVSGATAKPDLRPGKELMRMSLRHRFTEE